MKKPKFGLVNAPGAAALPSTVVQPKFTPGPWYIDRAPTSDDVISIQSAPVFTANPDNSLAGIHSLDPVDFANAQLIIAGPDMFALLWPIARMISELKRNGVTPTAGGGYPFRISGEQGEAIIAAVEKALGGSIYE